MCGLAAAVFFPFAVAVVIFPLSTGSLSEIPLRSLEGGAQMSRDAQCVGAVPGGC